MAENSTNPTTAENTEQETVNAEQAEQTTEQTAEQAKPEQGEKVFTQADVDRMIAQRLSRAQKDAEAKIRAARDEGRTEAEKLAKMTEQQRVEHEKQEAEKAAKEREKALAKREAEITNRELRATAVETLREKGLPVQLADILVYHDADSVLSSVATVEKVVRAAIQEGVDARLKASGVRLPASGGAPDYSKMSDAEYYAAVLKKK